MTPDQAYFVNSLRNALGMAPLCADGRWQLLPKNQKKRERDKQKGRAKRG